MVYLFEFINDHGECFKNGSGGPCQGDNALWAVPFRDVDASSTLKKEAMRFESMSKFHQVFRSVNQWKHSYTNHIKLLSVIQKINFWNLNWWILNTSAFNVTEIKKKSIWMSLIHNNVYLFSHLLHWFTFLLKKRPSFSFLCQPYNFFFINFLKRGGAT